MEGLIMAGQLILALMILVGIHEFGHMITAKWFGMRVEKFSIGFPPKVFGFKKGETEYMLGIVPLGGFVKISGMVDESMDKEQMALPPKDYEFRSKPAWQRLIVMLGGIIMNVFTGIVIFVAMLMVIGISFLPYESIKGIVAYEMAEKVGLKTGDKITLVNGKPYEKFSDIISPDVLLGSNTVYTVQRGDSTLEVRLPSNFIETIGEGQKKGQDFISPILPFSIKRVITGLPADQAGLKDGDKIIEINGEKVEDFGLFQKQLAVLKGKEVALKVLSKDQETKNLKAKVSEEGKLGFEANIDLDYKSEKLGFGEALVEGTGKAFSIVFVQIKAFGKMFKGELNPANSLSGPIGIAQQFGGQWDWERFWAMTALLSMVLAFMNLLPIPALDGGHVVFLTFEMLTGRKPSEAVLENSQKVGMAFLLLLMVFVIGKEVLAEILKLF